MYSALLKKPRMVNGKRAQLIVIGVETEKATVDEVHRAAICHEDVPVGEPAIHRGPNLLSDDIRPLVDDLLLKSSRTHSFERRFRFGRAYVLLHSEEFSSFFEGRGVEGWNVFYEEFVGAEGFKTLSRVGFNPEKTKALVYVLSAYTTIDTFTTFVLLEKQEGEWLRVDDYTCNSGRGGVKPEVPRRSPKTGQ